MRKYRGLSAASLMSALGSMGISGVPPIEQPFKTPTISEPPVKKNTSREQQRRMRQQAKKMDKDFREFYNSTDLQLEGTLTGRFSTTQSNITSQPKTK